MGGGRWWLWLWRSEEEGKVGNWICEVELEWVDRQAVFPPVLALLQDETWNVAAGKSCNPEIPRGKMMNCFPEIKSQFFLI